MKSTLHEGARLGCMFVRRGESRVYGVYLEFGNFHCPRVERVVRFKTTRKCVSVFVLLGSKASHGASGLCECSM